MSAAEHTPVIYRFLLYHANAPWNFVAFLIKGTVNSLRQLFIYAKSLLSDRKTNSQRFPQREDMCNTTKSYIPPSDSLLL